MNPIELLEKHCEFNSPFDCYVLLAVSRKKDTPEITNSQEIVFREIIRHEKDVVRKYNKIVNQARNYRDDTGKAFPFYVYVSLNARNSLLAYKKLKEQFALWDYELAINAPHVEEKIRRTDRHFISALASPECRVKNRYFMIDYDEKQYFEAFKELLSHKDIEVLLEQETKNGYHIKVKPYDRRIVISRQQDHHPHEIKTDAQFFVEYIKVEE